MEKMNQVSVSEFMAKSKEEMYDMAVKMVEKYNRLVDICNDTCERIATLVLERDNLSKDVQKLIGERDELIERHSVYTSALNKDIADKAAKIDLLEKEIEGRKEGYIALKKRMDTDYISIAEHNNICEEFKKKIAELEKELADRNVKIRHQKENLDGINKTLEIRTKENESLIRVRNNLNKEIEAHESENARLSEKIINLKGTITELSHEIDNYKSWNASLHNDIKSEINNKNDLVDSYEKKYDEFENRIKELEKERDKHIIDRNATIMQLEKQVKYLEKELNETCTCKELDLKGHNRREMALVNELADKNDEIKKLKESIEYYKNQERIRTDQLRATESKVEELWEEIERLRDLGEHWKRSYFNIRYSLNKLKDESKEDDYGKSGFKRYIEHLIEEEERAVPERFKERLNKEITEIFTKEEETEVNDIPCGSDAIE